MKLYSYVQDIKKLCSVQSSGSELQGQGHSSRSFIFSIKSCPSHNLLKLLKGIPGNFTVVLGTSKRCVMFEVKDHGCKIKVTLQGFSLSANTDCAPVVTS